MDTIACSTCLESFTPVCDVSTTPCGHVFHTKCINRWIKNEKSDCPQCRQSCSLNDLMKIYFSGTKAIDKEPKTQRISQASREKKLWTKAVSPAIYSLTGKGSSINYVVSKSAKLDPPLSSFLLSKVYLTYVSLKIKPL